MLFGLSNEGFFLGDFCEISLVPLFALFQKMRVLGDLEKIAITWQFGHVLRQNLTQSLRLKSILITG